MEKGSRRGEGPEARLRDYGRDAGTGTGKSTAHWTTRRATVIAFAVRASLLDESTGLQMLRADIHLQAIHLEPRAASHSLKRAHLRGARVEGALSHHHQSP